MIEQRSDDRVHSEEAPDSGGRSTRGASDAGSDRPEESSSAGSSPIVRDDDDARTEALEREVPLDVFIGREVIAARDVGIEFPDDVVYERTDIVLAAQSREERIRRRAYEIFRERSRAASDDQRNAADESGDAVSDWLAAEREELE